WVYALTIDAPTKCADECDAESARASSRVPAPQRAPSTCSSPLPPSEYPPHLYVEIGTNPNASGSVWRQQGAFLWLSPWSGRGRFRCVSIVDRWPKNRRGQGAGLKREIIRKCCNG